MKIKEGYLYHLKDEFFELVNDETLMANHEKGKKRPTYFVVEIENVLWFIPLSSKVEKYKVIIDNKIKKYGYCNTILIRKILNKDVAILLQNAFPTLEKYIDHIHTYHHIPAKVNKKLKEEILKKFRGLLKMKEKGINLFFSDIDKIKNMMIEEMKK